MQIRCPHCQNPIEVVQDDSLMDVDCPSWGSCFNLASDGETMTHEATGMRLIAHFELVEQIGIGTFGVVWKARDTELDRIVALKIPRESQVDATRSEMFLREARAAAQLSHPNIVSVMYGFWRNSRLELDLNPCLPGRVLPEMLPGLGHRLVCQVQSQHGLVPMVGKRDPMVTNRHSAGHS